MRSASVPCQIADGESLARRCNSKDAKAGKKIKPQLFLRTKAPLDISLDRMSYTDVPREMAAAGKAFVVLNAAMVRARLVAAVLRADKPPAAHAQVFVLPNAAPRAAEKQHLTPAEWNALTVVADELAEIARVP